MVACDAMSDFIFQWPSMLAFGLAALPLVWMLVRARRARRRLTEAMGERYRTHRALRDHLRVSAFLLLVLALARPGYAPEREAATRNARDVVFALDVSRSMLARDVTPSRLEVAKQGIRDVLELLEGHRVGLLVYAGSASILAPLSYDRDFVRFMLDQAHPRSVDFGGTTLQAAVERAVDQVFMEDRRGGHDLVVLTDGEDHGSSPAAIHARLEAMEVDALIVGLGDAEEGAPIPIGEDSSAPELLEVDGEIIYTRLDGVKLRELAALSDGIVYYEAGTRPFHLGQVYGEYASGKPIASLVLESAVLVYREGAVFFIVPALLLLLISERWGHHGLRWAVAVALIGAALPVPVKAADVPLRKGFEHAQQYFEAGDFAQAAERFAALSTVAGPNDEQRTVLAVLQFNRGLSLVQLAELASATSPGEALQSARAAQEAFLQAKRLMPEMDRAGIRLAAITQRIKELEAAQKEEESTEEPETQDPAMGLTKEESDDMDEESGQPEDDGESRSRSESSDGDFAAGAEMQELPVPNYSAEDILLEEQGNRQFREQQRASANAGAVEKDY